MRPTPIPDAEFWEGATRKVIAAPDGRLDNPDIASVEALVDQSPATGHRTLSVRCVPEDDDLAKLQAGGTVWLTFWGRMVPWTVTVVGPTARPGCRWTDCQQQGAHSHDTEFVWVNPGDRQAGEVRVHAGDDGLVTISEAALAQLLTDAGWERAR
ncbi:hypothetical protein [Nocardioides sp. SYSU D00065]|uniref:hypothetical protein n=1 Tax=Nocardioides sp. SYSU D00065 TaxID=2817378 RepID=UPI001B326136|nr:hypothetical protein [Nocardioides sp. SYSU D00065]